MSTASASSTSTNSTSTNTASPTTDAATGTENESREDWQIAGDAWGHAAADWAYRFEPHARDSVEYLFDTLNVGVGTRLLDLACGSGYALGRAERLGATTAGIDASSQLLEIAARRAPNTELVAGSMFDLPWPDDSFDIVTSFNGVWGGCEAALAEAHRVLRPGGSLALTFWGPGHSLDLRDFFIVVGTTAPGVADELKGLATIGAPGIAEEMLQSTGFTVGERGATSAVLEAPSADDLWLTLRSAGVIVPSLEHVGEEELRRQSLAAAEPFRSADGSYRLVNELTHIIGHA